MESFCSRKLFVQEKLTPKDVQEITRLSEKELKIIVERELKNANDKVEDAIDAVVEQSQENAKRLMEKKRMRNYGNQRIFQYGD